MESIGYYQDWWVANNNRYPNLVNLDRDQYDLLWSHSNRKINGAYRTGGYFLSLKRKYQIRPSQPISIWSGGVRPAYIGSISAILPPPPPPFDPNPLADLGPELYAQAKPDKPSVDLGVALAECRDIPRLAKQTKEAFTDFGLDKISSYYLAVQFGYRPVIDDARKTYQLSRIVHKKLQDLYKNEGRPLRRSFPSNSHSSGTINFQESGIDLYPRINESFVSSSYVPNSYHWESKDETISDVWFVGQFRYWLPESFGYNLKGSPLYDANLVMLMAGLTPSPRAIYKAMPWSWLIDWFSNVGDNIDNLSTNVVERLICDYAYVMRHVRRVSTYTVTGQFKTGNNTYESITTSAASSFSRKERIAASPFGFSIEESALSPFQLSILGALTHQK